MANSTPVATSRRRDARARQGLPDPPTRPSAALVSRSSALLLALVLGGLYGFNRFREQAIADVLRQQQAAAGADRAVTATSEAVPHFATGIGSLAAVHQVTVTPEVGGRVTAIHVRRRAPRSRPATRWSSSTTRPIAAISPITRRRRAGRRSRCSARRSWRQRQVGPQQTVDQNQVAARPGQRADRQDRGDHRAEADPRAVRRPARGAPGRSRAVSEPRRGRSSTLTDLQQLYVNFTLPSTDARRRSRSGRRSTSPPTRSPAATSPRRSRRSSRRSAPTPAR